MIPKIILLLGLFLHAANCDDQRPIVKTSLGKVKGYLKSTQNGKNFASFEGIPYAKPPVGKRRFQPPEPAEPWLGTWDSIFVSECVQTTLLKQSIIEGEEDCLHVNVYVPREVPEPNEKLDVIVHIHGGAFMYGSGHAYANPDFIMEKDVILVTFNYRVGMLGFLSTEDDVVPGNNGLKDQVLALKWVQNNIAYFGGNPKSITLTGLSAGGSSVHLHYLSDMSKRLFHRGFSQSGVALNPWALQEGALDKAKILANAVGCSSDDTNVFIKCLKQRHYRHLITKMPLFFGHLSLPISPFGPVVENGADGFLNENPYQLLVDGNVQDLPWMVSNTAHEGLLPGAYLYQDMSTVDEHWIDVAPYLFDYNYTLPQSKWANVAQAIRKFYLDDKNLNEDSFLDFVKIFTHRFFTGDAEVAVKLQAKRNKSPVYYYNFGYPGSSRTKTVSHADDGQYFFYKMFQQKVLSEKELKMKDVMMNMLISFTKTGKPSIPEVDWKPTGDDKLTYLKIDGFESKDMKLESVKEFVPRSFWISLGLKENENLVRTKDEL